MLALVLSGGANYGAIQAGALEVLMGAGLRPDMVVGTSAGGLNAIQMAADPTPEGARRLSVLWREAGYPDVGGLNVLRGVRRFLARQDSLIAPDPLIGFLSRTLPAEAPTFGKLFELCGVRAYVVGVCMDTGTLRVFGDREDDRVFDGAMATTGMPPFYAPWPVQGRRYFDGGMLSKFPLIAAIQRGATQIVGLNVSESILSGRSARGVIDVSSYAVLLLVQHQTEREIALARSTGVELRLLQLPVPEGVGMWDFSQGSNLVDHGRKLAEVWLEQESLRMPPEWWIRVRCFAARMIKGVRFEERVSPELG